MKLTKEEALKKIEELKEFVKDLDAKESRFIDVEISSSNSTLLEDEDGKNLVECRVDVEDVNSLSGNNGHFWINGDYNPFEIVDLIGNVLLKSDDEVRVRFLKEDIYENE